MVVVLQQLVFWGRQPLNPVLLFSRCGWQPLMDLPSMNLSNPISVRITSRLYSLSEPETFPAKWNECFLSTCNESVIWMGWEEGIVRLKTMEAFGIYLRDQLHCGYYLSLSLSVKWKYCCIVKPLPIRSVVCAIGTYRGIRNNTLQPCDYICKSLDTQTESLHLWITTSLCLKHLQWCTKLLSRYSVVCILLPLFSSQPGKNGWKIRPPNGENKPPKWFHEFTLCLAQILPM